MQLGVEPISIRYLLFSSSKPQAAVAEVIDSLFNPGTSTDPEYRIEPFLIEKIIEPTLSRHHGDNDE